MKLTHEQKQIVEAEGNMKINAVAGSGKTTTLIAYAAQKPRNCRILYLAFNKTVRLEAKRKFAARGLSNVHVETAHSLAYKHIVRGQAYQITPSYKVYQVKDILGLEPVSGERGSEYLLANHILNFSQYFCNSQALKVQEINYLETIKDQKARTFVENFYGIIEHQTRIFLSKMYKKEIEITHDFYLKKFQLSQPQLAYDYILFDEGQDASPCMLAIFLGQKNATKVIVGDTHQQIYAWRYAINSLEAVDFPSYELSISFRFDPEVALLAKKFVDWKGYFLDKPSLHIFGRGEHQALQTRATLARTNLALLAQAIQDIDQGIEKIYFEGNIHSYTYANEGASLYDILYLFNGKNHLIRDPLIKSIPDFTALQEYVEQADDAELGMMTEIVQEYRNDIPQLLQELKARHLPDEQKLEADMVYSTVHRCKGMEYDEVILLNDFLTEEKLKQLCEENPSTQLDLVKLTEEINLLYVAVTRTRNRLHLPFDLSPKNSKINWLHTNLKSSRSEEEKPVSYYEKAVAKHKKAYQPWSDSEDKELEMLIYEGKTISEIARYLGRTTGAIRARVKKLGFAKD